VVEQVEVEQVEVDETEILYVLVYVDMVDVDE